MGEPATPVSSTSRIQTVHQQAEAMNRMYRWTRHIYDFSRKYYLLGRDRMLDGMEIHSGNRVLEVGCGTGRNLVRLAKRCPDARFYGVDIAQVMIEQAQVNIQKHSLESRVNLACCAAESLSDSDRFQDVDQFDIIFFSYSLSMIPTWEEALESAWKRLRTNGQLYVVDFWDQSGWPEWFAGMLTHWLRWFGVHFRPELLGTLKNWKEKGRAEMELISIQRNYAYLAKLVKIQSGP